MKKVLSLTISFLLLLNGCILTHAATKTEITYVGVANNVLTIEGTATTQNCNIHVMTVRSNDAQNVDAIIYDDVTKSDADSNYTFVSKLPDTLRNNNDATGYYTVYVCEAKGERSEGVEFCFISSAKSKILAEQINKMQPEEITAMFQNADDLLNLKGAGILTERFIALDSARQNSVSTYIANKTNITSDNLQNIFNEFIFLAELNSCEKNQISNILGVYNRCLLNLNVNDIALNEMMNKYTDSFQYICEYIENRKPISKVTEVQSYFELGYVFSLLEQDSYVNYTNTILSNKVLIEIGALSEYNNYYNMSSNAKETVNKTMAASLKGKYYTLADFISIFKNAVCGYRDTTPIKKPGGGGGGGGGGTSISSITKSSIEVTEPKIPLNSVASIGFADLNDVAWAEESITRLTSKHILSGYSDKEFGPNEHVTREQYVKMIILALQLEDSSAYAQFSDITETDWCYPYISAAMKLGIVNGMENNLFGIGEKITRQDMTVIAARALECSNIVLSLKKDATTFDDIESISHYARSAVALMQRANVITGVSDTVFAPTAYATRAEAAVIIDRIISNKEDK